MKIIIVICLLIIICISLFFWWHQGDKSLPHEPTILPQIKIAPIQPTQEHIREQIKAEKSPPEIERLKHLVNTYEQDTNKWDIIITIGDIYRKGAFPRFLPNEELAMRCFKIAAMCPDGKIAGMGQSKYIEAYDDPINILDKAGKKLPIEYGYKICELAENTIKTMPWQMFEKPKMQKRKEPEPINLDTLELPIIARVPFYKSDAQNVHDHGITKATLKNIEDLEKLKDLQINMDDIKKEIENTKLEEKTKQDALRVLDNLSSHTHSSFNTSEQDTLKMVWNKIKQENSEELRSNLTETLTQQLASGIENGHVVCSSGKITRIIGTLDGTINENTSRPMWAIRDEIATLAAKTRDEMIKNYGDSLATDEKTIKEFTKRVKEEYVDKLGMSGKIIEPLIDEYMLGFQY